MNGAFYDESIKYPEFDGNKHCMKFDEIYESIILIGRKKRKTKMPRGRVSGTLKVLVISLRQYNCWWMRLE